MFNILFSEKGDDHDPSCEPQNTWYQRFLNFIQTLHPFLKVNFVIDYSHYAIVFQPVASKDTISNLKDEFTVS